MSQTDPRLPVTVALPVKNEQENLRQCLPRLRRFADVVVIDSGSSDKSVEIAQEWGARILHFSWDGRFPKKRNWFLLSHPPIQPWVLFLDADEFIDDATCDAIQEAVHDPEYDGYWLAYRNHFLGYRLNYGIEQKKLALFRVGKAFFERIEEDRWTQSDMEIHEHPIVNGRVGEIRNPIDHQDYKGLGAFISKHRDYAIWEARRYLELRECGEARAEFTGRQGFKYRHIRKWWYPWFYFIFTYFGRLGVLDGRAGFNYAFYKAWYFQSIRLLIREFSDNSPR